MLRIRNLHKSFGGQIIFNDVNWFVSPNDRVALVGVNGSGKSTLLRMVSDLEDAETGKVDKPKAARVGYLAQTGFVIDEATVREEARRGFDEILALQKELSSIEADLQRVTDIKQLEQKVSRQSEIHDRLSILSAHDIDRQISEVLQGLGFREQDFDTPISSLSGGWQMRAALARILLQRPDWLLLDEPTNHLDIEARTWLQTYLTNYPFAFVLVSHDRYFLDATVNRVTEITGRKLEEYAGNFTSFEAERDKRLILRRQAYERQQEEIKRITRFIERFRYKSSKASQVQSRVKMLAKIERLDPPESPVKEMVIPLPPAPRAGRVVLELKGIDKTYGDNHVLRGVNLRIERGARVALVGPNGAGKSTLMRALSGTEESDRGERVTGHNLEPAFFAQDQTELMKGGETVLESVASISPIDFIPQVRKLLGAFLFSGVAVDKLVSVLSGGERNRLALARLLVRPSNLLLLDEPTNHLDIRSKDVLLKALDDYEGTVVFVSHDRHFMAALADHIVEIGPDGVNEYPGDYESYLWRKQRLGSDERFERGRAGAAREQSPRESSQLSEPPDPESKPSASPQRNQRRLGKIETEIAELEDRKKRFSAVMGSQDFFANRTKADLYLKQMQEVEETLAALYQEWEKLAE